MIRTAAYDAICSTMSEDAPLWPVHRRDGQCLIHIEAAVLDRLTPAQIAEAQRMACEWKPTTPSE
jgi:hypothetical protein